ncbi:hypothetical protein V8C86DRAFT_2650906 [Haematococcus lacustris]
MVRAVRLGKLSSRRWARLGGQSRARSGLVGALLLNLQSCTAAHFPSFVSTWPSSFNARLLSCAHGCSNVRASLSVLACRAATTRGVSCWLQRCLSSWMRKVGACSKFAWEKARQVRDRAPPHPSCTAQPAMSLSKATGKCSSDVQTVSVSS